MALVTDAGRRANILLFDTASEMDNHNMKPLLTPPLSMSSRLSIMPADYLDAHEDDRPISIRHLSAVVEDFNNTHTRCTSLASENRLLNASLTIANGNIDKLQDQVTELNKQVSQNNDDLTQLTSRCIAAVQQNDLQAEEISHLKADLEVAQDHIKRLRLEVQEVDMEDRGPLSPAVSTTTKR